MKANYNDCLQRLLKDEGGYSNNPSDSGGPTNFGITLAVYRKYIDPTGTALSVKNMTVAQAKAIYKPKYWDAMKCDDLSSGVDYTVFDYGVNSGISRALNVYKKFNNILDPVGKINAICDERMAFLRRLKTFPVFGTGWTRRVTGVKAYSLKLANAKPAGSQATVAGAILAGTAGGAVAVTQTGHPYLWIAAVVVAAILGCIGVAYYYHKKESTNV